MNAYNKKEVNEILNSKLLIHWWNFNTKTLDFDGTVKEYLENLNVKYSIKSNQDNGFEVLLIKATFSIGSLKNVSFTTGSFEDLVRMVVNVKLTYLGDRSRYVLRGRTRNFTY